VLDGEMPKSEKGQRTHSGERSGGGGRDLQECFWVEEKSKTSKTAANGGFSWGFDLRIKKKPERRGGNGLALAAKGRCKA